MDYITAAHQAIARLHTPPPAVDVELQAALRLACLAVATDDDPAWGLLGADLLAVLTDLYPHPEPVTLHVTTPAATDPTVRATVIEVVRAVADTLDRTDAQPTDRRVSYVQAATRLRSALQGLP